MGSVTDSQYLRTYMNLYIHCPHILTHCGEIHYKILHIILSRIYVSCKNYNLLKGVNETKTCILHLIWKNIGTGYA